MESQNIQVMPTTEKLLIINQSKFNELAPKPVVITGNINAPSEYFKKRSEAIKDLQNNTHVLVDSVNNKVILFVDEENPFNFHKITGSLIVNPEFTVWGINEPNYRGKQGMIDLIKPRKHFFSDKTRQGGLLTTFMKFAGKIEKTFEDSNDLKGNKKKLEEFSASFTTYAADGSVDEKFNNKFTLEMPIFIGFPKVQFEVELCLDPTDTGLKFFFQSVDLYEKLDQIKEAALAEAVLPFKDYCPVIHV